MREPNVFTITFMLTQETDLGEYWVYKELRLSFIPFVGLEIDIDDERLEITNIRLIMEEKHSDGWRFGTFVCHCCDALDICWSESELVRHARCLDRAGWLTSGEDIDKEVIEFLVKEKVLKA